MARLYLEPLSNNLHFHIAVTNTNDFRIAHIHRAPAGVNGPVIADLLPPGVAFDNDTPLIGNAILDAQALVDMLSGYHYVDVHTVANPAGEIRGQVGGARIYQAVLNGANERPNPVTTSATGQAILALSADASEFSFHVMVKAIEDVVLAHIHVGRAEQAGPAIFDLKGASLFSKEQPISGTVVLDTGDLQNLAGGKFYINVHTQTNPGGEIRGQVEPFSPNGNFQVLLNEGEEVGVAVVNALGIAAFQLNMLPAAMLQYAIRVASIDNIILAHIHKGVRGANGPVIFDFEPPPVFGPLRPMSGSFVLDHENLVDLLTGYYYVNVHTKDAPGGKIRGQLQVVRYVPTCYSLTLSHSGPGDDPVATPLSTLGCPPAQYEAGAAINLHAAPAGGARVSGWQGTAADGETSTDNRLTMPAGDHAASVTYAEIPVDLPGDAYEADDDCTAARTIATDGVAQRHTFHQAGDVDWVTFAVAANTTYRITVSIPPGSPADVALATRNRCDGAAVETYNRSFSPGVLTTISRTVAGPVYLHLSNVVSSVGGDGVGYQVAVRPLLADQGRSALIVAAGSLANPDRLQANIDNVSRAVYALHQGQGLKAENIYFLSSNPLVSERTASATLDNLRYAITQWAKERLAGEATLTLYLMDHGDPDKFYLDNQGQQVLTPQDLDLWLDELEEAAPDLRITVIIEACYSGSFIEGEQSISLDEPRRLVVTSTNTQTLAFASTNGAYFSDFFLAGLRQGYSLAESFRSSYGVTRELFGQTAEENMRQEPQLDANGNGVANEPADITLSTQYQPPGGEPPAAQNLAPYIEVMQGPSSIDERRGLIQATVHDDQAIRRVWAVIRPPSYRLPESGAELAAETAPTIVLLEQAANPAPDGVSALFAAEYPGFDEVGVYQIAVFAEDDQGLTAQPRVVEVQSGSRLFLPLVNR